MLARMVDVQLTFKETWMITSNSGSMDQMSRPAERKLSIKKSMVSILHSYLWLCPLGRGLR
jgi:hypothetical protein